MKTEDENLLRSLAAGKTQAAVAAEMGEKRTTLHARLRRIVRDQQCDSTTHLIAQYGRREGLLEAAAMLEAWGLPDADLVRERAQGILP